MTFPCTRWPQGLLGAQSALSGCHHPHGTLALMNTLKEMSQLPWHGSVSLQAEYKRLSVPLNTSWLSLPVLAESPRTAGNGQAGPGGSPGALAAETKPRPDQEIGCSNAMWPRSLRGGLPPEPVLRGEKKQGGNDLFE